MPQQTTYLVVVFVTKLYEELHSSFSTLAGLPLSVSTIFYIPSCALRSFSFITKFTCGFHMKDGRALFSFDSHCSMILGHLPSASFSHVHTIEAAYFRNFLLWKMLSPFLVIHFPFSTYPIALH